VQQELSDLRFGVFPPVGRCVFEGDPEGLCLQFGTGCRRLAGSAPAPPACARIWTLLVGVPGYVSWRFPHRGVEESGFAEQS